jgi:hypothetical protein
VPSQSLKSQQNKQIAFKSYNKQTSKHLINELCNIQQNTESQASAQQASNMIIQQN